MSEPIGYASTGPGNVSVLFCVDCGETANREVEPLTEDDLDGFDRAECAICGATFYPLDALEHVGPFHYTGEEGFEAWGFVFPSGFTILEWIPNSVPDDEEGLEGFHQSVYHSVEDFRRICRGTVEWGATPEEGADRE